MIDFTGIGLWIGAFFMRINCLRFFGKYGLINIVIKFFFLIYIFIGDSVKVITSMPKNDIDFQNNLLLLHLELITKYLENYELDTNDLDILIKEMKSILSNR